MDVTLYIQQHVQKIVAIMLYGVNILFNQGLSARKADILKSFGKL